MRIFIGLVTPDKDLRRHFGLGKESILPTDALKRGVFADRDATAILGSYAPAGQPSSTELEKLILARSAGADCCLLLIDRAWDHLAANIRNACFSLPFDSHEVDGTYHNFFHRKMSRFLRSFNAVATVLQDGDDRQLMALPIRNFQAAELQEIVRLCRDDRMEPQFNNALQRQINILRGRRRPRRRSKSPSMYIVDDARRFFSFGKEMHSRFGTGDPHRPYCELNAYFRYGNRIDSERHYNVSETEGDRTKIEGEFTDCHGDVRPANRATHLNMFSNDFF